MNKVNKVAVTGKIMLGIVLVIIGVFLALISLTGLIVEFFSEAIEGPTGFGMFLAVIVGIFAALAIVPGARMIKREKRKLVETKEQKKFEESQKAELDEAIAAAERQERILQAKQREWEANRLMKQMEAEKDAKRKNEKRIEDIDGMEGHEFEYFCADLLRKNGFANVLVTQGSGDQGVDILAEKEGIRYAIQCKNYASKLGNTPVQEVNTGKTFYNCHVGVVMTNSLFTPKAIELAEAVLNTPSPARMRGAFAGFLLKESRGSFSFF